MLSSFHPDFFDVFSFVRNRFPYGILVNIYISSSECNSDWPDHIFSRLLFDYSIELIVNHAMLKELFICY